MENKIDIACGERPNLDCLVHTDIYTPKFVFPEGHKFVLCPCEEMPFEDKEFDFSYCHHGIEHVQDPDKACSEIIRISKSGILYFPTPQIEMLLGRSDHNWYVFIDSGRLLFIQKFHKSLCKKYKVERENKFIWKGSFEWTVVL